MIEAFAYGNWGYLLTTVVGAIVLYLTYNGDEESILLATHELLESDLYKNSTVQFKTITNLVLFVEVIYTVLFVLRIIAILIPYFNAVFVVGYICYSLYQNLSDDKDDEYHRNYYKL